MLRLATLAGVALLAGCDATKPTVDNAQVLSKGGDKAAVSAVAPQQVQLKAADGVTVYGTYYPTPGRPKALILLFHQAGSSKGEYAGIAPQLVHAGYAALAIDQRSGGGMYGPNRTAAGAKGKDESDYLGALPDMEAAFAWAKTKNAPIILWGSSYSASLVFMLAASAKDQVHAVIAFSPGEYFNDKKMIETAAGKIDVPVFVDQASTADEIAEGKAIVTATASTDRQQYLPKTGIHGSSTLNASKNPGGADENWRAVLAFLKRVAP
jgi:dienelactone hydrolase